MIIDSGSLREVKEDGSLGPNLVTNGDFATDENWEVKMEKCRFFDCCMPPSLQRLTYHQNVCSLDTRICSWYKARLKCPCKKALGCKNFDRNADRCMSKNYWGVCEFFIDPEQKPDPGCKVSFDFNWIPSTKTVLSKVFLTNCSFYPCRKIGSEDCINCHYCLGIEEYLREVRCQLDHTGKEVPMNCEFFKSCEATNKAALTAGCNNKTWQARCTVRAKKTRAVRCQFMKVCFGDCPESLTETCQLELAFDKLSAFTYQKTIHKMGIRPRLAFDVRERPVGCPETIQEFNRLEAAVEFCEHRSAKQKLGKIIGNRLTVEKLIANREAVIAALDF